MRGGASPHPAYINLATSVVISSNKWYTAHMSKSIRIRDHLYEEIDRLAKAERRPLVSQLELLLEQALAMDTQPITVKTIQTEPVYIETQVTSTPRAERLRDDHFKPDPK